MSQSRNVLKEFGKLDVVNERLPMERLAAATVLDAQDSGKTFVLALAGGFTATLPLPQSVSAGWHATFVVGVAPTTSYIITGGAANIHAVGSVCEDVAAPSTSGTAVTNVNLVANQATVGDRVHVFTDGLLYFAQYHVDDAAHITLT
jgi:hypothetical protein